MTSTLRSGTEASPGGVIMDTLLGPLLIAGAFGDEDSAKFYFVLRNLFR